MPTPNDSLVAVLVSKLDENLREDWEERASIMQFDALLPKGYAECLAMLDLLCRHPEVLQSAECRASGVTCLQIELDGQTQWIATTDMTYARQHLADIHAGEIAVLDLRSVIEEQYGGVAMLATMD